MDFLHSQELENYKDRVLDFHDSAKCCSSLLFGVKCVTIRSAKSTFKKVFLAAVLYV